MVSSHLLGSSYGHENMVGAFLSTFFVIDWYPVYAGPLTLGAKKVMETPKVRFECT